MERLKRRTVISLAASYASQLGTTGAEFLTKIVLAWLIMPTQWGIFAEAMLIVLIADVFTDLGLSQHLVREKSRPFGNVLLLRSILALGAIAVVEVFAPYLKFFTPQLIGPTRALAPLILIKAVGMVPTVYVDRELIVQKSLLPQFARLALMAAVSIV
ncbi:MAG TPA: oligosaccharide flippase family protein, partial [Armatimonadota bacterium]|nr:oligosaccharide flippase family protein [Armatimonadota bacterium]